MAQRFPGAVPNQAASGPAPPGPPQRYPQPQNSGMRHHNQQNFPVTNIFVLITFLVKINFNDF